MCAQTAQKYGQQGRHQAFADAVAGVGCVCDGCIVLVFSRHDHAPYGKVKKKKQLAVFNMQSSLNRCEPAQW